MFILLPSFKKGCCQLQQKNYVHKLLVNCLFKLAQEKVYLGELTTPMTIAGDWDVKQQNKQTNKTNKQK